MPSLEESWGKWDQEVRKDLEFYLNIGNFFTYEWKNDPELRVASRNALAEVRPFWRVLRGRLRNSDYPTVKKEEVSPEVLNNLKRLAGCVPEHVRMLDTHFMDVGYGVGDFLYAVGESLELGEPLAIELLPFRKDRVLKLAVNKNKYRFLADKLPPILSLLTEDGREGYCDDMKLIMGSWKDSPWPRFRNAMNHLAQEYQSRAYLKFVGEQEAIARMR